jgi:hypothetical protein
MKIILLTILLTSLSTQAFAGYGTGHYKKRWVDDKECTFFYDNNNKLIGADC